MTQKTNAILKSKKFIGINTKASDYSELACDLMLSRLEDPSAPVLTLAQEAYDTIRISWTEPTVCADGTALNPAAIVGYNIYEKVGSAPTRSTIDLEEFILSTFFIFSSPDADTHYFGVTCVDTTGRESILSNVVSGKATGYLTGADDPAPGDLTGDLYISQQYIGYYDVSESKWTAYIENNGDFFLVGATADYYFQWDHSDSSLTVAGTYKSALSGQRIQIESTSTWGGAVVAYDSSEKGRATVSDEGFEVYNSSGHTSTANRILFLPNAITEDAVFKYENTIFEDTVIIGQSTDPSTSDKLYVAGNVNVTGVAVVGDHGTAATAQVINACYGTGSPPTASDTPIGTIFIKYV